MAYYQTFANEALEQYRALPEESNELYTKRFINIKLEEAIKESQTSKLKDTDDVIGQFYTNSFKEMMLNFDMIVGNSSILIRNSKAKYIKSISASGPEYENILSKKMYGNEEDKYVALTHAHTKNLISIDVPDKQETTLQVLFLNKNEPLMTQVITKVGNEAKLSLFEWHASESTKQSFSSVIHEVDAGKYSHTEINILHNEDHNTTVIGNTKARVGESGKLRMNYVYTGGSLVRVKNYVDAIGFGGEVDVSEMIFGSKEQKFDINTYVINSTKSTIARLDSRAALMNNSICYLKGFAKIVNGAKESRSYVQEHGMLIDKTARIDSIPSMSIDENAVKATHSSSSGPLDEESMFYLMTKGINETKVKQLLISGFFSPTFSKIGSEIVKAVTSSVISEKIKTEGNYGTIPKLDMSNMIWVSDNPDEIFEKHYKYRDVK